MENYYVLYRHLHEEQNEALHWLIKILFYFFFQGTKMNASVWATKKDKGKFFLIGLSIFLFEKAGKAFNLVFCFALSTKVKQVCSQSCHVNYEILS